MRGDAAILFFAMDLIALVVLLGRNNRRKIIFVAGSAVGSLLVTWLHPTENAIEAPWKFGYSSGTITLVLLISCFFYSRRNYIVTGALLFGILGVNLLLNFRSPVLDLLVAIVLILPVVPERIGRLRILPHAGSVLRVAVLVGFALGAAWSAGQLVKLASSSGIIGEEAQEKNETQAKAGVLLGGRPEIQVSAVAVWDSPILGHGSWAQDYKYIEMLNDIEVEQGIPFELEFVESSSGGGLIPSHSHLMGAWVWAGILGAVFWAYILWMAFRGTLRVAILRPPMAPLFAVLVPAMIWNILFSPFGLSVRMSDALTIVIMADLLENSKSTAGDTWARLRGRLTGNQFPRRSNPRVAPMVR